MNFCPSFALTNIIVRSIYNVKNITKKGWYNVNALTVTPVFMCFILMVSYQ